MEVRNIVMASNTDRTLKKNMCGVLFGGDRDNLYNYVSIVKSRASQCIVIIVTD